MNEIEKRKMISSLAQAGITIGTVITAFSIYNKVFQRVDKPDYKITPGLFDYDKVRDRLPRTELYFKSGKEKLQGYYYQCKNPIGLVVVVHGFKSGSDDYLPITMYLVKNGFNVFSYDSTGTYNSSGKSLVGFNQYLVDLDHALDFIENKRDMSRFPLFLLGHSCGGFAVNSVLSIHKNIKACASFAAVNDCFNLLLDKGAEYVGPTANEGLPKEFLDMYQKILFGKYCDYTAIEGAKNFKNPMLIAHGISDETITFDTLSLICHRDEIKNPKVQYYFGTGPQGLHDTIWHSTRAIEYKNKVTADLKKIKKDYDQKVEYCKNVDHELYSEINYELFDEIINLFKSSIK